MKRVWIINHYAVSPTEVGSTRHFEFARRLSEKGWDTTIFAASFSHWEKKQRLRTFSIPRERTINGVKFHYVLTPPYKKTNILRIINILSFFFFSLIQGLLCRSSRPDVIVGSSVHPLAALAAQLLAAVYKVPFVFEVRDLWPETLVMMGKMRRESPLAKALYRLEARLYMKASKIISLPPEGARYISQHGGTSDKTIWIPNGVEIKESWMAEDLKGHFTVMYLGSHGKANALDVIIDGIEILQKTMNNLDIHYRFIGEGDRKMEIQDLVATRGIQNISFESGVGKSEVHDTLLQANVLMLSVADLPELYQFGVSINKIFDYMAAGRPVLIAMNAVNNPVSDADAGECVPPEDPQKFAESLSKFYSMSPGERELIGRNGRDYVEQNHSFDILAGKFYRLLEELV